MQIDRQELLQEIILRKQIQKIIRKKANEWIDNRQKSLIESKTCDQDLRQIVRNLIPSILKEDQSQTKEEVAISLVRDTLLAVVKIIKSDQGKFKDTGVQDGFIKYCLLALGNDFEENRGEEGEAPVIVQPDEEAEQILEEFPDDGDNAVDIKVKASDHEMFIPDEEDEEEEAEDEEEEATELEKREEELYLTLTDSEKVGFRYAKDTTWPKVTKQIKRIHKMALPDANIVNIYEKWLTKNIELHGENTKEESTFEDTETEVETSEEETFEL